jgi:protein-tyrosine phosphatase
MASFESSAVRVLFVCLGNICRSPMAEAVFAHKVGEAGLADKIYVDSAGTGDWHIGEPAHPGTRKLLAQKNIPYAGRARQFTKADINKFDYILTMDDDNLRTVRRNGVGTGMVRPFLEFAPELGITEVPDPWYTGNFEETYQLVEAASDGLLEQVKADLRLKLDV